MKYIKLFEAEEIKGIWFVIDFSNEENWTRSIKKIEKILNVKVIMGLNLNTIKERYNQPYTCISVGIKRPEIGYMPLIDTLSQGKGSRNGVIWFQNHKHYKFGGYINCTKEEVNNYIEMFENINKYNV